MAPRFPCPPSPRLLVPIYVKNGTALTTGLGDGPAASSSSGGRQ
ncbi:MULTISPECIES: hypothetical protein [Hymenobacter]